VNKKTYLIFGAIVAVIALIVAYQLYVSRHKVTLPHEPTATETVTNPELAFSFAYPKGSDAFTLLEPDGTDKGILKSYIMMPASDYESYKNSGGEAPAAMNVFVLALGDTTATTSEADTRITELQNWAADNSTLSSIKQAKATPDVVVLDGVKALHYEADGLYKQDIYLVSYRGHVYMFVGQYDKQTDVTYTAFQDLIKSVLFD
jgi:hypothetical protein